MENEEIKVWNEGKPNVTGSSGMFGVFGGVLGRGVKLFSNTVKQYLKGNPRVAKQYTATSAEHVVPNITTKVKTLDKITPKGPQIKTMKDLKVKGPHSYDIKQL